jgi:hypothetical protein
VTVLKLAALSLAAVSAIATASPAKTPALDGSAPWWEKITVTMNGEGKPKSCRYESSKNVGDGCEVVGTPKVAASAAGDSAQVTQITFERRFTPSGGEPDLGKVHAGETILGGQVMALAIDQAGRVSGCKVVAKTGEMTPDYGCQEAAAERFAASVSNAPSSSARQAFMTILVYGHSEQVA